MDLDALQHMAASVFDVYPLLASFAIGCALMSAAILLWFLLTRPALDAHVKAWLLVGLFVFPIGTAATGNVAGFIHTKNRSFCGSCHVMTPYRHDVEDAQSTSLASAHGRNETFGEHNCYECHREYGAFSTILTKLGGMRHVYEYYLNYHDADLQEFLHEITIRKPMKNASCMRCHSTEIPSWLDVPDHASGKSLVRSGKLSCLGAGCHGPAHPFSKPKRPAGGGAP